MLALSALSPPIAWQIWNSPISEMGGCWTSILRQLASALTNRAIVEASLVMTKSRKSNWYLSGLVLTGKKEAKVSVNSGLGIFLPIPHSESLIGMKKRTFWIVRELLIRLAQLRQTR